MKYIYRLWPFQIQDHKIAALWLDAMEEKGWCLRSIHPIFHILKFERINEKQKPGCLFCYDTDIFSEKDPTWGSGDEERDEIYNRWTSYVSMCEDAGWELIGRMGSLHIFRSSKRDKAPPIQTDPEIIRENTVGILRERYKTSNLPFGVIFLIISILLLSRQKENIEYLLYNSTALFPILTVLLSLVCIGHGLIGILANWTANGMFCGPEGGMEEVDQQDRKLKREEAQTSMIYRAAAKMYTVYFFQLIFTSLLAAFIFSKVTEAFNTPIDGFAGIAYLLSLLPAIAGSVIFSGLRNRKKYIQRKMKKAEQRRWCKKMGCDIKGAKIYIVMMWVLTVLALLVIGYGEHQSSVRSELHWRSWAFSEISAYEEIRLENGSVSIDYYNAKSKWVADRIYNQERYRMIAGYFYPPEMIPEEDLYASEINNPQFFGSDRGIYRDDEKKSLLLQKGNKVISLRYYPNSSNGESGNLETDTRWQELFWDL